ncbi:MAG: histidine phosphatase family protein [Acidimicrobiia bacterium]
MKEIVFIRHAESQANTDGVWNGRTDGPLSEAGEASLEPLGERLRGQHFDVVISSPLIRARRTAAAFADEVVIDERFVEIDLGRWEGMAFDDVIKHHGEELRQVLETRTLPMGGTGESIEEAGRRALAAVDDLAATLEEDQRAAVVTHGGFLQSVLHRHLPGRGRRVHAFTANTAITRLVWQFGRPRLATFNDVGHLGPRSPVVRAALDEGTPVFALVRHGRTQANVERRWQGQGDWDLDEVGRLQAEALAAWYGKWSRVYSSPLRRATSTAERVARNGVVPVEELKELNMGRWEGLTTDEIIERWPELMATIHRHGVDLRRGETGETWGELTARVRAAMARIEPVAGEPTVVVAHGGALRAYLTSLTAIADTHSQSLYTPANTSVTHVALTERGPEILDYAVAAHLESIQ